jgi:metal-sulfur cluster biosynthetic enzyme
MIMELKINKIYKLGMIHLHQIKQNNNNKIIKIKVILMNKLAQIQCYQI